MRYLPCRTQGHRLSGMQYLTGRNLLFGEWEREISALSVRLIVVWLFQMWHLTWLLYVAHGVQQRSGVSCTYLLTRAQRLACLWSRREMPPVSPRKALWQSERRACQPADGTVKETLGSILRFSGTGQLDFPISRHNQKAGKRLACWGNKAEFGICPDYTLRMISNEVTDCPGGTAKNPMWVNFLAVSSPIGHCRKISWNHF